MKKHRITLGMLLVLGSMSAGTAWAGPATTNSSCTSSCPSTCEAQQHFGNLAKESLALSQPPNPQTSFNQGCLSGLQGFNISSDFNFSSLDSMFNSLAKKMMDQACSTLTSTMNNEISQGNNILNFALDPAQLEQNALNSASSTVLNAEQGALNTASGTVSNATGTYASDAGSAETTVNNAPSTALSGSWVNNLY
ncbi:hypothetical protein ACJU26_05840 [Acidithiobacillus sp. M4-SHS-6]|uniref:hypothetical protein n=1 Tax=Acidithiobacillus sp. M4-SHS-6 TaxID=3383024 RepID=UPI0039BDD4B9